MFHRAAPALAAVMSLASPLRAADYLREVKPVLKSHCYACHGALKQKAGLRLDTVAALKKGGDNGDATKLIIERVTATDKKDRMPPEGDGSALNAEELARLKAWIAAGAPAPAKDEPEPDPRAHWAYQPPRSQQGRARCPDRPAPCRESSAAAGQPSLRNCGCVAFISISSACRRRRRRSRRFSRTPRCPRRERVVDRLLASPQYGERWARHFMDIWRYCDWYGLGAQLRHSQKHIWHWRDWIVESLNADKGYDRMIVEMLAADEARAGGSRQSARHRLSCAQLLPLQPHHLARRHRRAHQPRVPRRDDAVREVPRPQIRSHRAGRLLPDARHLRADHVRLDPVAGRDRLRKERPAARL